MLLMLGACSKPKADPWPRQLHQAMAEHTGNLAESEHLEYRAGFVNGATMVREAMKAGLRPYKPVLGPEAPPPKWLGPSPEGVKLVKEGFSPEVDPESGLMVLPLSGAKHATYSRGQVDGFAWALSIAGQSLVRPMPDPGFPERWMPWQVLLEERSLEWGGRTLQIQWAPGLLAWALEERGFPSRRIWRPWADEEPPLWIGLTHHAIWVESSTGQAVALDPQSGGILRVRPASPHEPPRKSDFETRLERRFAQSDFHSPESQRSLEGLRKAAESGEIPALLALAERLSGHGEQAEREAFALFLNAAEKGSPEAMLTVGVLLFHGQVIPGDKVAAKRWLDRAVQAGHPKAAAVEEMLFRGNK